MPMSALGPSQTVRRALIPWQIGKDDFVAMFYSTCCKAVMATRSVLAFSRRRFTSSPPAAAAQLPSRSVINEDDLEEAFLKGSGPGGQKIVCQPSFRSVPLRRLLIT